MSLKFPGKIAIITGAGKGIGYEIARQLIHNGANVLLNDIDAHLANESAQSLTSEGPGTCIAAPGNAADVACIKRIVAKTVALFGRLDFVIANAGTTHFGNFLEYSVEDFQDTISLNLQGPFFLAQEASKQIKKQKTGGRIILMSSTVGLLAYPHLSVYSITKAALHMMAKSLVLDLSCLGITINAIAPGATLTERTLIEDPDYEKKWSAIIPSQKTASPLDIAKTALFLLSPDASHITGQTIIVDGGWSALGQNPDAVNLHKLNGLMDVQL